MGRGYEIEMDGLARMHLGFWLLEHEEPAYHPRGGCTDSAVSRKALLNSKIGQYLRLGFIHCQQIVAGRTVLRDSFAVLGGVVPVMAPEASGRSEEHTSELQSLRH